MTEAKSWVRAPILVTALLLALALSNGVFAYNYITDSPLFNVVSAGGNLAAVSANTDSPPSWTAFGSFRGSIGGGTLFAVDTTNSAYTGDLVATISIANGDQLSKVYRVLAMRIKAYDSNGSQIDINHDNSIDSKDFALLTLRNGAVDVFIDQTASDTYQIMLDGGYYVSHIYSGWGSSAASPILFCDIGQLELKDDDDEDDDDDDDD